MEGGHYLSYLKKVGGANSDEYKCNYLVPNISDAKIYLTACFKREEKEESWEWIFGFSSYDDKEVD